MHWLPLVAMVIASALPFPHNPATTQPGSGSRREHRRDPASFLPAPSLDYGLGGNASRTDSSRKSQKDYINLSVHRETSTSRGEDQIAYKTFSSSASRDKISLEPLRTEESPEDKSLPKDYKASRKEDSGVLDTGATMVPGEDGLTLEAGLGLGVGMESLLEIDEMFLDAHPRVLFSPSPSPPEHPPLLLMLENGLTDEEGGELEEQEDADGRIEGHGDRANDRSTTTPSWANYSRRKDEDRPFKRNKRSPQNDSRRGEKSVCESESVWVTDKTTAIDTYGKEVTILQEIQTQTGSLKQYFYETRCRQADQRSGSSITSEGGSRSAGTGVAGAGCLGVDTKQWKSMCKARQSFVRALSKDANNRMGWRWIRIDSSCVCVLLSRTNKGGKEVLPRRGRV
ncbi:beta-nerve growth factor [Cyprinodon tularosa]|uniref:beta-nerve growth factor n=1 Tax=Cyprinodon tularosa TaxID=77115 RepID=UPI0018E1E614|nr:beta-nerve growth factor [Cyprinodon tularosa]